MIPRDMFLVPMAEITATFSSYESLLVSFPFFRLVILCLGYHLHLIVHLQDKTNSVIDLYKDILRAVEDLTTCSYTSEAFSELLGKVQAAVSL